MVEDNELENEFSEAVDQINAKLEAAAKLMAEARKIGEDAGLESLTSIDGDYDDEVYDALNDIDFSPILNELSELGWRTSSLTC